MGLFDQLKNMVSRGDLADKAGDVTKQAQRGLSEFADKSGENLQKAGNKLHEVGEKTMPRDSRIKSAWPDSSPSYRSAYDPRGNAYIESATYDSEPAPTAKQARGPMTEGAPVWRLVPKHLESQG